MNQSLYPYSNRMIRRLARHAPPEVLRQKLNAAADSMGDRAFGRMMAREIVGRTQPQKAVPEVYTDYRRLVCDGIEFFLSHMERRRMVDLVVSQLKLAPDTSAEYRLLELAKRFPTLHKLGQIIARHPNIDQKVKQWLVHLENGDYGTPAGGLVKQIEDQLERTGCRGRVEIQPAILSEASVGAVIAFEWDRSGRQQTARGIFKVLKPDIQSFLREELTVLEQTARFFEAHRSRYPLKDFKFLDLFRDVRHMLVKEIDLAAEQRYLAEARQFYADMNSICIPQCFPFSSDTVTAMTFIGGPKITDANLNREQRRRCAAILFEALACRPLFSRRQKALFHGDPHAGNILAAFDPGTQPPCIGLLDWSLAGRLTRHDRVCTVRLIQAILKKDLNGIRRAVKALSRYTAMETPGRNHQFEHKVIQWMRTTGFGRLTLIKKAFRLLELLTYEGFVFPAELMLFRKAIFTLEGVLHDLWPGFDMDAAVMQYMTALMAQDAPRRCFGLLFPLADHPENYTSLISNGELHSLMLYQYTTAVETGVRTFFQSLTGWPAPQPIPVVNEDK